MFQIKLFLKQKLQAFFFFFFCFKKLQAFDPKLNNWPKIGGSKAQSPWEANLFFSSFCLHVGFNQCEEIEIFYNKKQNR